MTKYEILSHLVTLVAIASAVAAAYCVLTLVRHYVLDLDARLDEVMDEWGMWAEAERERRWEVRAFGRDRHNSLLGYYGPMTLIERWLFLRKHDAIWALVNLRERRIAK